MAFSRWGKSTAGSAEAPVNRAQGPQKGQKDRPEPPGRALPRPGTLRAKDMKHNEKAQSAPAAPVVPRSTGYARYRKALAGCGPGIPRAQEPVRADKLPNRPWAVSSRPEATSSPTSRAASSLLSEVFGAWEGKLAAWCGDNK